MTACFAPHSEGLLAPLSPWLQDPAVSEILLNKPQEIYVEKHGKMSRFVVPEYTQNMLQNLFKLWANENKKTLTVKNPILSGSTQDGSRIQLVIPPTAKYPTFSIRRKVVHDCCLHDYENQNTYQNTTAYDVHSAGVESLPDSEKHLVTLYRQKRWGEFIKTAIHFRKNIVISGGTSSGKTTFLNACLKEINSRERLIILEDTREVTAPHPNQVNLLVSQAEQDLVNVTMQDLVQCCLRLRPDRIVMGEIRGKEMMDFVSACSTGHEGAITTIHANNPRVAFMRMIQMYKLNNVPSMTDKEIMQALTEVVDIIIQLHKTSGGRRVHSLYYQYGLFSE